MRCSSHFLPKFDNLDSTGESPRLTADPALAGGVAKCLAISKKHSGHLVMCPPFYSKNGSANAFSRMGEIILRAHFKAAWPDGEAQFDAWWIHAEAHALCYCFECVVPRLLGDHGATPKAAYMVLTCVTHTGGGGILSPAQLLALAAAWRLPLNEVWYVRWEEAGAVEDSLHEKRWTIGDEEADRELERRGTYQGFLSHSLTQGPVLEGFVLMALDTSPHELAPLLAAYEAAVAPVREACLAAYLGLAAACHAQESWLIATLELPSPREPRRLDMAAEVAWRYGREGSHGPLSALFRTLRALYAHRVHLKAYEYSATNGRGPSLQLQIEGGDDQIFFGWPLHMGVGGAAPLYRGMVVQFDDVALGSLEAALGSAAEMAAARGVPVAGAAAALPSARVLRLAKLKCLRYLARTFGVRNLLPTLLSGGPPAYLSATQRFFTNWSVPAALVPTYAASFAGWAAEVQSFTPAEVQTLRSRHTGIVREGSYLAHLEPYLEGHRRPRDGGGASFGLEQFCVIVSNLSGAPLPAGALEECVGPPLPLRASPFPRAPAAGSHTPGLAGRYAPGMLLRLASEKGAAPCAGTVLSLDAPPGGRFFSPTVPTLVLIVPPGRGVEPKWTKMMNSCQTLDDRFPSLAGGRVFVRPPLEQWKEAVAKLAQQDALPTLVPRTSLSAEATSAAALAAATAPASSAANGTGRSRLVIAVLALPPGGGKSSLYAALARGGAAVVSSDEERAKRHGNFDSMLGQLLQRNEVVCYDKNIPDATGLSKLVRVLSGFERSLLVRIHVLVVVPATLQHDVAWARVRARPREDIALNIHTIDGGERAAYRVFNSIFFRPSLAYLPAAQALPGAVVSDAFWQGTDTAAALASQILSQRAAGEELGCSLEVLAASDGGTGFIL